MRDRTEGKRLEEGGKRRKVGKKREEKGKAAGLVALFLSLSMSGMIPHALSSTSPPLPRARLFSVPCLSPFPHFVFRSVRKLTPSFSIQPVLRKASYHSANAIDSPEGRRTYALPGNHFLPLIFPEFSLILIRNWTLIFQHSPISF